MTGRGFGGETLTRPIGLVHAALGAGLYFGAATYREGFLVGARGFGAATYGEATRVGFTSRRFGGDLFTRGAVGRLKSPEGIRERERHSPVADATHAESESWDTASSTPR